MLENRPASRKLPIRLSLHIKKFPEPGECIIDRVAREHMSLGSGAHLRIGRDFARLMPKICLRSMLAARRVFVPKDFVPEYTASEAQSPRRLPMSFTPGPRLRAA